MLALALLSCALSPGEVALPQSQPTGIGQDSGAAGPCDASDVLAAADYAGPSGEIALRTDSAGVVHVSAASEVDAFYAQGYLMARDRLWQLEMNRRRVRGERAEVLGAAWLSADQGARLFGFGRHACESLRAVDAKDPSAVALLVAFVEGMNARIDEVSGDLSAQDPEFAQYGIAPGRWTPEDSLALGAAILFGFSDTLANDVLYTILARTTPGIESFPLFVPATDTFIMGTPAEAPPAAARGWPPLDPEAVRASTVLSDLRRLTRDFHHGPGSNNWAVSGAYTEDGRPLLANDTHSGLGKPNTMYMVHLQGGDLNVAGWAFVGSPSVQLGHNAHLSWAATTHWADVVDIWDVARSDTELELFGQSLPITREEQIIRVRQADGSLKDEPFTVEYVEGQGVILSEAVLGLPLGLLTQDALLARHTIFAPSDDLLLFVGLNRAADLDAFAAAIDEQSSGMMSWIGATAAGIEFRSHGDVPLRGGLPYAVQDGSDPSTAWQGWLGPDSQAALPRETPLLGTANNDVWGHTADNEPANDAFYYGAFFDPGWRAHRIAERLGALAAAGPITVEDMQALQLDTHSEQADAMLPLLVESRDRLDEDAALAALSARGDLPAAVDRLLAWDRRMDRPSPEAALFRVWMSLLSRDTIGDELSLVYDTVEAEKAPYVDKVAITVHQRGLSEVLDGDPHLLRLGTLAKALDWIAEEELRRGLSPLTWGDLHAAVFTTPDGVTERWPADGANDTLDSSECSLWSGGRLGEVCGGVAGPILRQVTRFRADGTPQMSFVAPYAHAGGLEDWLEGRYQTMPFTEEEVEAATVERSTL